jgi:pimeloyl-ACP methyl ester carboxylesterase
MYHPLKAVRSIGCSSAGSKPMTFFARCGLILATISLSIFASNIATAQSLADPKMLSLATGSRVAIWTLSDTTAPRPRQTPIVYLHGGPGMFTTQDAAQRGASLRAAGFTTIYFDQAGGGQSDRLPATQYSLQRAVEDVEALRVALNAPKLILWGSSYGASLAALYARRYPAQVVGLIFSSPGSFPGTKVKRDYSLTNRGKVPVGKALSKAVDLVDSKGAAAEATLTQADAGRLLDELVNAELLEAMVCKGSVPLPHPVLSGSNLFANRMLQKELAKSSAANGAPIGKPVLVVRGACDFLPVQNAERYQLQFGGKIVTIAGAGHQFIEKPAELEVALANFAATEFAHID